jgi:hypothetical protein
MSPAPNTKTLIIPAMDLPLRRFRARRSSNPKGAAEALKKFLPGGGLIRVGLRFGDSRCCSRFVARML